MPKAQGSPSADFCSFLVGLLYPWLVGVNSPVSPSWVFPVPHPPAPTVLPPLPWPTPQQPLPVRASRAAAEAKMSSLPPDFQLSLKRAARPVSVWAVVLHLSDGLFFLDSSLVAVFQDMSSHLAPCTLSPFPPFLGSGPSEARGHVTGRQLWGTVRTSHHPTLASNASPLTWFSSCPNWNTVDPEVKDRLTRRNEDGEFW